MLLRNASSEGQSKSFSGVEFGVDGLLPSWSIPKNQIDDGRRFKTTRLMVPALWVPGTDTGTWTIQCLGLLAFKVPGVRFQAIVTYRSSWIVFLVSLYIQSIHGPLHLRMKGRFSKLT